MDWDVLVERHASGVAAFRAAVARFAEVRHQGDISRYLVLKRCRRQRGIQGGSGDPSIAPNREALRQQVRDALRLGSLPLLLSGRAWAAEGSGKSCAVCGQAITKEDVEHEVDTGSFKFAHASCAMVWREESARVQSLRKLSEDGPLRQTT